MKICVFGSGAVGGLMAAWLARAGHEVSVVARGAQLDAIRRDVWVNWFAGDTAALRQVLAPELVAISPDSDTWQDLEGTLASSARYKAGGGKLAALEFSNTTVHRMGDVVVMFSRYNIHLLMNGEHTEQKGRATEVFVRHGGTWVHTSWQLDVTP